ncbi:Wadjet anti-phage system protein JetA family protein [Robinsoniella peoriensis]|uniref:Wadjet anti-phage system protein JetA family protein n=1 Tax=Robinsoniella peoriensis TaxID=180332 RepID=UPI003634650F
MQLLNEIPESFWSLFRSPNRNTYMEALLKINEEYQYNSYFLSREVCIQILGDYFAQRRVMMQKEELESELDILEPPATRILNWLLKAQWLKKLDDYYMQVTNIIIPDYAAIFIDAFERLNSDEEDDTQIYIQNIYAILFSFKNDPRANTSLLKTALVNVRKLNKSLQDMLHNMDKFFTSLLEQKNYADLLKEHLEGYVEEIINKKYHILKTSDNFYLYKTDIKGWIREMQSDMEWISLMSRREQKEINEGDMLRILDDIERGFDDIEHRISFMDREHMKYVRATVTRLNYLLNGEADRRGLVIQLLNELSAGQGQEDKIKEVSARMNLSSFEILSDKSLYKKRRAKSSFHAENRSEEVREELSREEILKLNQLHNRYSKKQIEEFIENRMENGRMKVSDSMIETIEEFEQLILAYDYAIRKGSGFAVESQEVEFIENGKYRYPNLMFVKK